MEGQNQELANNGMSARGSSVETTVDIEEEDPHKSATSTDNVENQAENDDSESYVEEEGKEHVEKHKEIRNVASRQSGKENDEQTAKANEIRMSQVKDEVNKHSTDGKIKTEKGKKNHDKDKKKKKGVERSEEMGTKHSNGAVEKDTEKQLDGTGEIQYGEELNHKVLQNGQIESSGTGLGLDSANENHEDRAWEDTNVLLSKNSEPVLMPRIEDAGTGRFFQETFERDKQMRREAFQQFAHEKAQTEVKLKTALAELKEVTLDRTKVISELKMERSKAEKMYQEVEQLKAEERNRRNNYKETDDLANLDIKEKNNVLEEKVSSLQLRLKNLVQDDSEKDDRIHALRLGVATLNNTIELLKEHVDDDVYNGIVSQAKPQRSDSMKRTHNVGQSVVDKKKMESKICSLM